MARKLTGIMLAAVLLLSLGWALAGDPVDGGNLHTSDISGAGNIYITGSSHLTIDADCEKNSIDCTGDLEIQALDGNLLCVSSGITADGEITLGSNTAILYPEGGKVADDGKSIVKADGTPAPHVVIGCKSVWYVIDESDGSNVFSNNIQSSGERYVFVGRDCTLWMDRRLNLDRITDGGMGHQLTISANGGDLARLKVHYYKQIPAISVGKLTIMPNMAINWPRNGKVDVGMVVDEEGNAATSVEIRRAGPYKITVSHCRASNDNDNIADNTAFEGDRVDVSADDIPVKKYCAGITSPDVELKKHTNIEGASYWSFTMPGKNVSLSAVLEDQIPYTFDQRAEDGFALEEDGLLYSMNFTMSKDAAKKEKKDGKIYYDLDGNGTADVVEVSENVYEVAETCNLDSWTSHHMNGGVKYTPITIVFKPATRRVSFDANGGSGTMGPVTVGWGETYKLPECAFAAPAGKAFSGWDLGAPGTVITVKRNVTVKAQWKDTGTGTEPGTEPGTDPSDPGAQVDAGMEEQVTLKKIKISKVIASSKKKIKVQWKKLSKKVRKQAKKIQVQVSTDKAFQNIVAEKILKNTKTSVSISGLKKKTKYYVRIRVFREEGNIRYVSPWSKIKSVKTKKK